MTLPTVKMTEGIHVMHLFYRVDRMAWDELSPRESEAQALQVGDGVQIARALLEAIASIKISADADVVCAPCQLTDVIHMIQ